MDRRAEEDDDVLIHREEAHPQELSASARASCACRNLLATQMDSYRKFLQADRGRASSASNQGLQAAFKIGLPDRELLRQRRASSSSATASATPAFDVKECQQRGLTYAAPLRVQAAPRRSSTRTRRPAPRPCKRHQGAGGLHGRNPAHDRRTAPSSSTAPSA
ncbi:MAG: hypothetical protein MZW92_51350 [Comamonadaceae bacterium]|nr:hypothetical protein [Comamonadaceae bacterium]